MTNISFRIYHYLYKFLKKYLSYFFVQTAYIFSEDCIRWNGNDFVDNTIKFKKITLI